MTENETKTLLDEVAALKARLSHLEAAQPQPQPVDLTVPVGCYRGPDGIIRSETGGFYAEKAETVEEYGQRMAARAAQEAAEQDAYWGRATAGLPEGLWRDPCGIIRQGNGALATAEVVLAVDGLSRSGTAA